MTEAEAETACLLPPICLFQQKAKQNGLPRRWQTVLFLKDDIKGRYYSTAVGIIFILGFRRIDR